jgi:hypothetical protein
MKWIKNRFLQMGATSFSFLLLFFAFTSSGFSSAALGSQNILRISSINGEYDPAHTGAIVVYPGDVVTLSADLFDTVRGMRGAESLEPQGRYVEDFLWYADTSTEDYCDPDRAESCLDYSNFEATEFGVQYYVPFRMDRKIEITVRYRNGSQTDSVSLESAIPTRHQTDRIITDPQDYPLHDEFHYETALSGMGRWVVVSGVRYWVPQSYQNNWQPYQNGHWCGPTHMA